VSIDGVDLDQLAAVIASRLAERLGAERPHLLSRPQLAERLGISERGVTALANRNELPAGYLIGGVRRWDWQEVHKYLLARTGRKPRRGRGRYGRERRHESPAEENR
jgi:hypothetical protein